MMKRSLAAAVLSCSWVALAPCLGAAEAPAPEKAVGISGRVAAVKGDGGGVRSATITTAKGEVYNLQMDERGQSLGKVMHGQTADILGVASKKDNARWLQVVGYADERVAAGHEYWRRMRCIACVVLPATRNAAVPADLHGATAIAGRHFSLERLFTAWARDARYLWVAADNEILQIDLDQAKVVRSFGKKEGLPDQLVYQLASDGKTLWVVHRGGVAALKVGGERVADIPRLKARFARVHADAGGVWVIADTGTFRLKTPDEFGVRPSGRTSPLEYGLKPALPTAERIRKLVENGIWLTHWARKTGHFLTAPASLGERLYVGSYGDIYELADGKWEQIAQNGWGQSARNGKLWFADARGLEEFDPATRKTTTWAPPGTVRGRLTRLVVNHVAAWLVADPNPAANEGPPVGGGLARFDLAAHTWEAWPKIDDAPTNSVACLSPQNGMMWAVTMDGQFSTKSAHPGMTTTKRLEFKTSGFGLHRFDETTRVWDSFPLKLAELENRLICGQDGQHSPDAIVPQTIEELSVGGSRIFAAARLVPKEYFGGYWPCIEQVATSEPRDGDAEKGSYWTAAFSHHPEQTGLQGEQPLVLNISSGELTRIGSNLKDQSWEAVGHDLVLGLFARNGKHWAVTESGVSFFDEAGTQAWQKLVEPEYRWYWRATAALEDGRWLYIGSDRGLVCRLDIEAGRFEFLTALKDRAISRIAKAKDGRLMVVGQPAPLGLLPIQLRGRLRPLDCDAAGFDGTAWAPASPSDLPPAPPAPQWLVRQFDRKDQMDKSQGNYLCGPAPGDPEMKPRYYVKEVFFPLFLCASADGGRLWLSTYTGLLRLDLGTPAGR